jgi:AGZA family xanthine/uracil permease-like MFS transporter
MLAIKTGNPGWIAPEHHAQLMSALDGHGLPELAVIVTLGNGFIMTSMIWTSAVAAMVDGRLLRASAFLLAGAALSLFGIIHSVDPRGGIYLPWALEGLPRIVAWQFIGAYVALAALMALLSLQRQPRPDDAAA